jgi:hypothetical protein
MPGGLMQLTGVGAQNTFVNGNPSMTYFTSMYKRSTNFAMEHFRLDVRNITDTNLPQAGSKTFKFKVPRYGDMIHDCYLCVDLPDIWSPLSIVNSDNIAQPYLFQWIRNIGYNMIEQASVLMNGMPIVTMTGEWMKVASYLKQDKATHDVLDEMVGNTQDLHDPANAGGRFNQYPNAIATPTNPIPQPSIRGRKLVIPLPFWFCENIGQSLPLVAMPQTEVEISITMRNIYSLFTIINVNPASSDYLTRVIGTPGDNIQGIQNFLSYPDVQGNPTNPALLTWNLNPYIEGNYIFLTDTERAHVAAYDRTYLINQVRFVTSEKQYGLNNLLIPMFNLCTRVVALFQRFDRAQLNDWDNYTNWEDPFSPPVDITTVPVGPNQYYSSGSQLVNNMGSQDILQEGNLVFDGKDRFVTKNVAFFRELQNYRFSKGVTSELPGINLYSFALDPAEITQPSGSANGSMFNKTSFSYTLLTPPVSATANTTQTVVCVDKSTLFSPNPVPVPVTATVSPAPGIPPQYQPGQTITVYSAPTNLNVQFQGYNTIVYIESYNFLKVTNGQANVVFNT